MLKLRTDTKYVTPDGKLTQAGVEAFQGLLDAQAASIATNAASIATNAADIAALEAIAISSAPGSAPRYACRAWVNFNGTGTVAIRASGNVASITDNGVGDYTVNFTTAMPDANYAVVAVGGAASAGGTIRIADGAVPAAGSVRIQCVNNGGSALIDYDDVCVAVFR